MVRGIGVDIVEIARFERVEEGLLRRLFTEDEIKEGESRLNRAEYYSSRFASKEAIGKALGTGFRGLSPKDIEIKTDSSGRPYPLLSPSLLVNGNIFLSISHDGGYSIAMAVIEDGEK